MSQGFHKGSGGGNNIFSFSDEFERPLQNRLHIAQQSRRDDVDRLRALQQHHGLFDASGPNLVSVQEEEEGEEEVEEEEEDPSRNCWRSRGSNMLSDMFINNYPSPAPSGFHLTGLHGGGSSSNTTTSIAAASYLQQINKLPAESFYVFNSTTRPDQMLHMITTPSSAGHWSSVLGHDDSAAAELVKHHPDSSTAGIRCFFDSSSALLPAGAGMPQQLSLSSSELQQLEMRTRRSSEKGDGFFFLNASSSSSSSNIEHQHQHVLHPSSTAHGHLPEQHQPFLYQQAHMMGYGPVVTLSIFRNSLYARAAEELLEELCSVGRRGQLIISGNYEGGGNSSLNPSHIRSGAASSAVASSSSSKEFPPLSSAHRFECQRKKSKLLSMLEEVERRYNQYCEQMQMVVNSFESVMGFGAATPYTALAQKAMSRHFRCLKDAITGQLKQTCELLGDKEGAICTGSGGLTKGETPKLRLIDQSLRQQRAFHQLGVMDQDQTWRPQRGLPDRSVTILRAWLFDHFLHPYPSDADKHLLARQTGLSRNQVSNWFINARVRLWKPMVEDMYQKEAQDSKQQQHQQQQQQQQQQQHINHQDETNSQSIILAAAATTRQQMSPRPHINPTVRLLHTQDSGSPGQDLRPPAMVALINTHYPQPHSEDEDPAASSLIFSPGPPHNDITYRRPADMTSTSSASQATTGDLSLTLGLRHAEVNPPETGRFGL